MFWPFNRAKGWRKVKGREGFTVEMPCRPTHKTQQIELDKGSLNISTFRASPEPAIACQLTVRQGSSITACSDTQILADWKAEFMDSMTGAGMEIQFLSETTLSLGDRAWELAYSGNHGRTTLKIRLIRSGDALFILSFIGSPDRLDPDGLRFLESFALTRGI